MKKAFVPLALTALLSLALATPAIGQVSFLAVGDLTSSKAVSYTDLSGLNYNLENGVRATELGGLGSAIAYAGRNTFLALLMAYALSSAGFSESSF